MADLSFAQTRHASNAIKIPACQNFRSGIDEHWLQGRRLEYENTTYTGVRSKPYESTNIIRSSYVDLHGVPRLFHVPDLAQG